MPDVYRNFKFEVEILGFIRAGFTKVSGMKHTVEAIDYREGGENETPHKLPGQSTFDNITLERGQSFDGDFIFWMSQIFTLGSVLGFQGILSPFDTFRRDVTIYIKNKGGARVKSYTILNAWPTEFTHPELDASANDVAIETLVLANEGVVPNTLPPYL